MTAATQKGQTIGPSKATRIEPVSLSWRVSFVGMYKQHPSETTTVIQE